MTGNPWTNGPIGLRAASRITRAGCRVVLVVVPHVVAGTRLVDLLPLLEADHRVQVLFTVEGSTHGTAEFVRDLGGHVLPWEQAIRHRFDLVLAASFRGLDQLHGKIMVVPHGAGALKSRSRSPEPGRVAAHGLSREQLVRDGRVVPSAIVLAHRDELDALRESCPEAAPAAVVAGDLCLDRVLASEPYREHYRRALGVLPGESLVTVSSSWTTHSTFGAHIGLYRRLLDTGHRVAAVLHPNIWSVHGARQVRAWLPEGLLVLPPEEGWRAAVVAADVVVGDFGSTTQYAAALGRPILLVPVPAILIRPGSPADLVYRGAPVLDPVAPRLDAAVAVPGLARAISSCPGGAGAATRRAAYRLLDLPEPARAVPVSPVAVPRALG
ncbi:hypothetical protein [Saccharothrix algeriensis]|uniref:Uncharacterized protein n=1 Tax=Saccharothrix algeriensis TaxID=173560 RepID=A0A8T8HZM0_9PSEU|nr:hypothetical protein [Saccharothrix algeriensis]MBM7809617.1 hypothetical protein [Saccharothrix algeriensis]QTR03926.1 hypothetical protein J7S33_02545 [Saccharothrix algeriensis]